MKYERLKAELARTLAGPALEAETVVRACDTLSREIASGKYDRLLQMALGRGEEPAALSARESAAYISDASAAGDSLSPQLQHAARLLSRPWLEERLRWELPPLPEGVERYPLGVLLHIGAGNMEGLPAYSVVEGLLAGNINLLKLPEGDDGISSFLLRRLVAIEPRLRPYVYVFRISSSDRVPMKRLASLADGIAVWGGDEAIRAVRMLAGPGVKLIEWGHKVSFAYVTPRGIDGQQLRLLARHMLDTGQVLCSSCQGIYLDTADQGQLEQFSKYFLEILESEAWGRPAADQGARARNTLRVQCSRLEAAAYGRKQVFSGALASVTLEQDPSPQVSLMFGNCWVKPLLRTDILPVLRDSSGYLQTVALICGEEEREQLTRLLWRAGAVRVCRAGNMSAPPENGFQPHDGEYPLARYSKLVT